MGNLIKKSPNQGSSDADPTTHLEGSHRKRNSNRSSAGKTQTSSSNVNVDYEAEKHQESVSIETSPAKEAEDQMSRKDPDDHEQQALTRDPDDQTQQTSTGDEIPAQQKETRLSSAQKDDEDIYEDQASPEDVSPAQVKESQGRAGSWCFVEEEVQHTLLPKDKELRTTKQSRIPKHVVLTKDKELRANAKDLAGNKELQEAEFRSLQEYVNKNINKTKTVAKMDENRAHNRYTDVGKADSNLVL